jgi:surfeit locus 1 family protein
VSPARRVFLIGAVLCVAAAAVALGRWQLQRLAARRASNAILVAARARPPLELPADLRAGTPIDSGRRVVAHGRFDPRDQLVVRGRVQNEAPGLHVVTPFVLDGGAAVLWVLRGFVPSPDAVTPPDSIPAPASGEVTIGGLVFATPVTADSGRPLLHNGVTTWLRLDRTVLARRRPGSLDVYLQLAGDANGPGRLAVVPPPELNNGPHLNYAIQWFGIALAVLAFGVIMLWRDGRALPQRPAAP